MGMVSIPAFSAVQAISIPREYHSFAIVNSLKAKGKSYQLELVGNTNVLKAYSIWSGSCSSSGKYSKLRTFLVEANQESSLPSHVGAWEDPDDGSGSESEEEEEEEEHDLGFQSEWEEDEEKRVLAANAGDVQKSMTNEYEEQLVKGM